MFRQPQSKIDSMCAEEIKQVQGCWASTLGDCAGKLSREHTVSECFWGDTSELISVQGMHWCADAPKMISVANMTAKILCEFHNNKLGETVDPVAALTTQSIKESMRLLEVRKKMRKSSYNVLRFRISGPLLERWFLKTLINFTELDQLTIRADPAPNRVAAAELVRIAFGLSKFPGESGLWLAARPPGGKQDTERRLQFRGFNDSESVIGGLFSFCGYHFYMNLEIVRPNYPDFNLRQT